LFGVYSVLKLCEARALPGREEISQLEIRDPRLGLGCAGNIIAEITRLNHIRRANPRSRRISDQLSQRRQRPDLYYSKATADLQNVVLVAVNSTRTTPGSDIEVPLGLGDVRRASVVVADLMDAAISPGTESAAYRPRSGGTPVCDLAGIRPIAGSHVMKRNPRCRVMAESALVQGCGHLSASCQIVLRLQQRWGGRLSGLVAEACYIASLGVNAIWLLPFYPSPRRDDGYDMPITAGCIRITARWRIFAASSPVPTRATPRHHRAGDQPYVRPAFLVSRARRAEPGSAARRY